jgi:hypothetical protein
MPGSPVGLLTDRSRARGDHGLDVGKPMTLVADETTRYEKQTR